MGKLPKLNLLNKNVDAPKNYVMGKRELIAYAKKFIGKNVRIRWYETEPYADTLTDKAKCVMDRIHTIIDIEYARFGSIFFICEDTHFVMCFNLRHILIYNNVERNQIPQFLDDVLNGKKALFDWYIKETMQVIS